MTMILLFFAGRGLYSFGLFDTGGTLLPHPSSAYRNPAFNVYPDHYGFDYGFSLPIGLFGLLRPESNPLLYVTDKKQFIEKFDFLTFYDQLTNLNLFLLNPSTSVDAVTITLKRDGITVTDGEDNPIPFTEIAGSSGLSIGGTPLIPPPFISFPINVGPFYFKTGVFAGTGGYRFSPDEELKNAFENQVFQPDSTYSLTAEGSLLFGISQSVTWARKFSIKPAQNIYFAVRLVGFYIAGFFEETLGVSVETDETSLPSTYTTTRTEYMSYPGNGGGGGARTDAGIIFENENFTLSIGVLNVYGFLYMVGERTDYETFTDFSISEETKLFTDFMPVPFMGMSYAFPISRGSLVIAGDIGYTGFGVGHVGVAWFGEKMMAEIGFGWENQYRFGLGAGVKIGNIWLETVISSHEEVMGPGSIFGIGFYLRTTSRQR